METTHTYAVDLQWNGSRKGNLSSPELTDSIEVATPPEFAGGIPGIWSPEHLFTAAISSCLMTTFLAIAENSKLIYSDFRCGASGTLAQVDGKFRMTHVLLTPVVVVSNMADQERALRILEKAERNCLITNSVSAQVEMRPEVRMLAAQPA